VTAVIADYSLDGAGCDGIGRIGAGKGVEGSVAWGAEPEGGPEVSDGLDCPCCERDGARGVVFGDFSPYIELGERGIAEPEVVLP